MPSSPLTILFAPAHTRIDEAKNGSEFQWPYKLIEHLALDHGVRVIALTIQPQIEHEIPGVRFISVEPSGALPTSNAERLRFYLRVYRTARGILDGTERIDVIHHMFPFGFRSTFNLLSLLQRCNDPPLVVGPLQPPLSFVSGDDALVAIRDFSGAALGTPRLSLRRVAARIAPFVITPPLSALSRATLRRSAALVAVSEQAARLYRSFTGIYAMNIIPPGVDTDQFTPRDMVPPSTPGREAPVVTIIGVGYLLRRKAYDTLIRAVGTLVRSDLPVRLRLVGEGPARPALESLVRELGIEHCVTFVGLVPHSAMVNEYQQADIFCSTSLSEGFATVSLEALACGLPIVATPAGGFRDVLTHHDVGTLIRFGDVDQLASALVALVADSSRRAAIGRRARALAVAEYDWSVIAWRYLALYSQVARPVVIRCT